MPQKVTQKKNKINLGIAIFTVILMALPVIITSFTGFSSFKTPYGIYALSAFGIGVYFSCIFGMFAWKNKFLYIVMDIINIIAAVGFVIYAYINFSYQGGLLLHIAAALLFTFGMYQVGDSDQGDGFYTRYLVPIAIDIAGLIFVLWFINVNMNVIAHIVIVSIINFLTLAIFLIPSIVKLLIRGNKAFEDIQNDEVETEEETEEEKLAKQSEKNERMEAKRQQSFSTKSHIPSPSKSGGVISTRRYRMDPRDLRDVSKELTDQFNSIVESSNYDIRSNNSEIRNSYEESIVNRATQSNKEIGRAIRYLRRTVQKVDKYLEKLSEVVFTGEDECKSFTFDLRNGKLKKLKQETDITNPSVRIMSYYARTSYITNSKYTKKIEIKYKGLNTYAIEIR